MKYEKPELTALTPAINAIQTGNIHKVGTSREDSDRVHDFVLSYEEWE